MNLRIYKYVVPVDSFFEENEPPALLREINLPDNVEVISHSMIIHAGHVLITVLFRVE